MSECTKPFTRTDKWIVSFMIGILFLFLSSNAVYQKTNIITQGMGLSIASNQGCPNLAGLVLHAILFTVILRLAMQYSTRSQCGTSKDKWVLSLIGGFLFLILGSPFVFDLINSVTNSIGLRIASDSGCPNNAGIALHMLLFIVIVRTLIK